MLGNILAKVMQAPAVVQQPAQSGSSSFQTMSVLQQDSTGESEEHLPMPPAVTSPAPAPAPAVTSPAPARAPARAPAPAPAPAPAALTSDEFHKQVQAKCMDVQDRFKEGDIKTKKGADRTFIGILIGKKDTEYHRADGVTDAKFNATVACIKAFWTALMVSYDPNQGLAYVKNGLWSDGEEEDAFSAHAIAGVVGKMQPLVDFLNKKFPKQFPIETLVAALDLIQGQRIQLRLPELPAIDHSSRKAVCKALAAHNAEMVLSALKVGFPA